MLIASIHFIDILNTIAKLLLFVGLGIFLKYYIAAVKAQMKTRNEVDTARHVEKLADLAQNLREQWLIEGKHPQFGPVSAFYGGDLPDLKDRDRGGLGLIDNLLVFREVPSASYEIKLPFAVMRWIETPRVNRPGWLPEGWMPVRLHCEQREGWRVYTFYLEQVEAFAEALHKIGNVPIVPNRITADLRSVPVKYYAQNIYGQWEPGFTTTFYLAPDRLLFNWKTCIHLSHIRGLSLIREWRTGESLLRIDYDPGEGRPQSVGLALNQWSDLRAWGGILQTLTGVKFEHSEERKKKDEKAETGDL